MSGVEGIAPQAALPKDESGPSSAEPPMQESPVKTYPIMADPEVKSMVLRDGWKSLITSEHQPHLRQHCIVCARWIVDPTALKGHLKQAHKDIWNKIDKQLDNQCAELKADLIRDGHIRHTADMGTFCGMALGLADFLDLYLEILSQGM